MVKNLCMRVFARRYLRLFLHLSSLTSSVRSTRSP